jgi:hypothetical protein
MKRRPSNPSPLPLEAGTQAQAVIRAARQRTIAKMKVQPTMLLKTNNNFLYPTMSMKTKVLSALCHDLYQNKGLS